MSNFKKKFIAIVTTVTLACLLLGPGVSEALTAEELQVQIDALLAQLSALQSQLSGLEGETPAVTPAVSGCTISSFDRNLKQGMSGDDVKCLQVVLNSDAATQLAASGVGSSGNETTYFGPLTKAAVVKFQEKYTSDVLTPWGLTAGTGFVGSTTRAKLNELLTGGEVVPPGCECTAWTDDVCAGGTCTATQMRQTRVCTPAACTSESQCVADTSCAVTPSAAVVSKADDSPGAGSVAGKAQDVPFLKLKFTAGSEAYTVTKVIVTRGGTSADADLSDIKLYEGATRVGSAQALSTTTHKATFSSLSWQVPANSTKYLTVTGSINQIGTGYATTGDSVQLGVSAAADLTSSVSLEGTFPIWSASKTIAGISVGQLDVDVQTTPAAATILSGSTDQEIASWRFTASSTEGFTINRIKITQAGSATAGDITNLKLKYAGTQIGSTVAGLAVDNSATFDLTSSPLTLNAGTSKIVYAYADIASGIWTSRTVIFEITEYTDVTAYGSNSGGAVTVTYSDNTAFVKQTGQTMTIGQGTLAISLDAAQNPAVQTYVKGTSDRLMTALKFSTGSREGARVTQLKLTLAGTDAAATDIANVTLWDGTTQIAGPASVIGSYVTFGTNTIGWDEPGVFDVPVSTNKTLLVKADIPTGANVAHYISLSVSAASNVKADGLGSRYDLAASAITGTATGNAHDISASGNLAVSKAADGPTSQTYVKGSEGVQLTKINFTADSGEDIVVSAITVYAYASTDTATALTSGDITSVKMCKGVKDTGSGVYDCETQYGSTVSTGTSSMSFSGNLTVAASSTESLTVVAKIPTTTTAAYVNVDVRALATYPTDVTSTGVASSADITETGSADGPYMTVGTGGLTLVASPVPADQQAIINSTDISYLGIVMTGGTAETVRVTMLKLARSALADTIGGTSYIAGTTVNDISNVALYDSAGERLTNKKNLTDSAPDYVTFSASDFLNSSGIDVSKGQQKTIYVKADAPSTATAGNCNALGLPNTSSGSYYTYVAATGLSSGTTLTTSDITITAGPSSCNGGVNYLAAGHANCYQVGLATAGVLSVAENAGRPDAARVAVGTLATHYTSHVFYKVELKSTYESVDVKSIQITRPATCGDGNDACGSDADFAVVSLYDGDTLLASQSMVGGDITFNFPSASYWRIPSGVTKTLTIKGTLNGVASSGTLPGDYTKLCLAANGITAQGASSGSTSVTISGLGSALCGQEQSLAQSIPTITVGSLGSTTIGSGTHELYKWTVLADTKDAIAWQRIAFNVTGQASASGTIRTIGSDDTTTDKTDGLYTIYAGDANTDEKIADDGTFVVKRGTTTVAGAFYFRTDTDANAGTYVVFVPTTEETVAAGESKTYTLEADLIVLPTATGQMGSISTRIKDLSAIFDADLSSANYQRASTYATVAFNSSGVSEDSSLADNTLATNSRSFIWSDKSGCAQYACTAQTTHAATTYDWLGDYKIVGLPSTTLTLQ